MTKIALVDIDGCLVQNRTLNSALVEKLKQYDDVVLFTQRSKFLQIGQISRAYALSDVPVTADSIITTHDAVEKLSNALGKRVKVSTSVDPYFADTARQGYYVDELSDFERRLKTNLEDNKLRPDFLEKMQNFLQPFNEEVEEEADALRKKLEKDERDAPDTFYPQGKVEQYKYLLECLPDDEDIEIDYFDDSPSNLDEITQEKALSIRPNCLLVAGRYACSLEQFKAIYGERVDKHDIDFESKVHTVQTIEDLQDYAQTRRNEKAQSTNNSEYHTIWARLFSSPKRSATTKINAAEKAIRILQGDEGVTMSAHEMAALEEGRLKNTIGPMIGAVKSYKNEHEAVDFGRHLK
ncbi:hypothetical protein [Legionella spiritensis]|uniref:hypothetical protein n=1 Tax=Legionella spiritensis TaxID=452 RepID=UPI000F716C7A|nr:hypothetical protein [Legionella spiritensis]VEG89946.1 Uncharacterised protein [Legionella spiritensis]